MRESLHRRFGWFVAVLMICTTSAASEDKPWSRAYRSEVYGVVQVLGSDEVSGLHGMARANFDTTPVYGVGMGVNINAHLNVNTEIMLGWADIKDYWVDMPELADRDENQQIYLWNVNLDYNILKGRLTPVVGGGVGILGLNGDDRLHEVHFAGNVGAGIRWDMTDHLALRVLYRCTWWEIKDADDPFQFDGVTASLIWTFK
ncbi:MAG TPA: outer membrane beta-barrel protein [Sedimentisphaerales bacterium]|jgi:opacity protein-like surface antigen|nr:outer membrane beta-barrel protein [Sedimentisphaerales bacterium]HNU31277.1 outer membrane beta-barrel protein [Sedimentisphaerales bacterium]